MAGYETAQPRVAKEIWLAVLELLLAAGLGFLASRAITLPNLTSSDANTQEILDAISSIFAVLPTVIGVIIGSFGALHALHRIITVFEVTKSIDQLNGSVTALQEGVNQNVDTFKGELSQRLDDVEVKVISRLNYLSNRVGLTELNDLYQKIDVEFANDKNDVIDEAKRKLSELFAKKISKPMFKATYYRWITERMSTVERGDVISAISRNKSKEWDNSPEERRFFAENRMAAEMGATVERVFVTTKELFEEVRGEELPSDPEMLTTARVLHVHSKEGEPANMIGWFADENRLQTEDSALLEQIGDGFLMFRNGRTGETVALIDDFTEDDEARGFVNKDQHHLNHLYTLFSNLKAMSDQF